MYLGFVIIDLLSLVFQAAVAVLAWRLIRITGSSRAWIVIAVAMLAMAIRRLGVLIDVLVDANTLDIWSDLVGLFNAVLMLVGVAAIAPLFRTIQQARETTQRARDQLEKEVQERTADLVSAHEKLQAEFTQRVKAEAAIRDEHRRLLQVLELCERDQRLVAYEIHDGFVQPATAALMNLEASLSTYATDSEKALENIVRSVQLLRESIAQVRWLISGLRPVVLENLGLVAAIDKLVDDTESRTEIPLGWSHQVQFDRLPAPLETSIFRIIQEALRNAVRHSRTDRIEIAITQTGRTVDIRIQDWGCGFDPSVPKPGHFGLEGMHERARLFGGAVRSKARREKGLA